MEEFDVAIVGAGFAGLACAKAAAIRGLKTLVIDRKSEPGASTHTTGLLVKEVAEAWDIPLHLTRKIRGARLYSPSGHILDLESPGYYFLATDTPELLRWFASEAESAGARTMLGTEFRGARHNGNEIVLEQSGLRCRTLVGADGPRSRVAQHFGLGQNRRFLVGVEAEYENVSGIDDDRLHCVLDSLLAPGYIGWVVPGCGITQIGLACRSPLRPRLDLLIQRLTPWFDFRRARVVGRRGGLIPVGGPVIRSRPGGYCLLETRQDWCRR